MRHRELGVEPDGLEDVLAVGGETLNTGNHSVGDVTGQTLYEHRSPVGVVLGYLIKTQYVLIIARSSCLSLKLLKQYSITGKSTRNLMNSWNVGAFLYFSSVTAPN